MKGHQFSIKKQVWNRISRRGWAWIAFLYGCSVVYYYEFFTGHMPYLLALYITTVIVAMIMVGYVRLGTRLKFPLAEFTLYTFLFSVLRFLYIYYFLSRHLPEYTIFHYPDRAGPSTIFGSASLLFLGYSYAIYEWGLAAREKYIAKREEPASATDSPPTSFEPPLALRSSGTTVYVLPQDVIFINANGEYVDYHTAEKRYTCFQRLKEVERSLERFGFLRTHRSYIINLDYVAGISTKAVTLKDATVVPLSKTYREKVKHAIKDRMRSETN